jgi:hypothetical protein
MNCVFIKNDIINLDNVELIKKGEEDKRICFYFIDDSNKFYDFDNYEELAKKWIEICDKCRT